jgi:AcrR family transcriptional regulator
VLYINERLFTIEAAVPRPKKITDGDVLEVAGEIVSRGGPTALTFAAVGERAKLAPATLVQRFGTREAMMRATLLRLWDQLDEATAAADAKHPIDAEGAIALLVQLSVGYAAPGDDDDMAQGLLLLREDFRDPVLRARGAAWGEVLAGALGRRLTPDPAAQETLGRLMASQWQGAVLWWGFNRAGALRHYLRRELRDWCAIVLGRRVA